MTSKREQEIVAHLLDGVSPSAATRAWLASPPGARALAAYRTVLARLDAWGAATATPRRGPRALRAPARNVTPLYYTAFATPIGRILAASGRRGLVQLSFGRSEAQFVAELQRRHARPVIRSERRLGGVTRRLAGYLCGARTRLDLPVDLQHVSPFQRRVLAAARRVPVGHVVSYGEIARRIGQPRASRAVGQALGRNPIPIVIPCHRVVAGGGRIGGYIGGVAIKRKLLALEGVRA